MLSVYLIHSQQILDPSRFLGSFSIDSQHISRSIEVILCALCQLDSNSTASRSVETLLHALFFTCFASFYYLVILVSCFITFMHLYGFLMSLDHLRSSLCFSSEALQLLVPFVHHDKKGEKMWFLFRILHVRGRNTCLCKGESCFILLGGVFTSLLFQEFLLASCTPVL